MVQNARERRSQRSQVHHQDRVLESRRSKWKSSLWISAWATSANLSPKRRRVLISRKSIHLGKIWASGKGSKIHRSKKRRPHERTLILLVKASRLLKKLRKQMRLAAQAKQYLKRSISHDSPTTYVKDKASWLRRTQLTTNANQGWCSK